LLKERTHLIYRPHTILLTQDNLYPNMKFKIIEFLTKIKNVHIIY